MKSPAYNFKLIQEAAWAGGVALLVFVLTAALGLAEVTDWSAWAVSLGTGCARAVAGAILAVVVPKPGGDGGLT